MIRNVISFTRNKINFSTFHRIVDLKTVPEPRALTSVKGWVTSVRKMKENIFFDVQDGSSPKPLQVVVRKNEKVKNIQYGCSIEVEGYLTETPRKQLELQAEDFEIIGVGNLDDGYPFAPRKEYSNEYYRQFLHLRPRVSGFSSILRIRNAATTAIHEFYKNKNYLNIHTPIITSNDCEGAGEVFTVEKDKTNSNENGQFFDSKTYLTVSGQLHLEVAARCFNQVYCLGPTFRAENSKSRLHLAEFYMLEAETAHAKSVTDLVNEVQELFHFVTNHLLNTSSEDISVCKKLFDEPSSKIVGLDIEKVVNKNFNILTYDEVGEILNKNSGQFKTRFTPNSSLTKDQELFLVKFNDNEPLFIVDWPKSTKPFYMKTNKDDPDKVSAFDFICPNVGEICGGSLREDDYTKLKEVLEHHNLIDKLEWYLDLRKFGNVLTGGYGLGFERYLQVLLNIVNIKDVIPFPRWPHNCKM